MVVGPMIGGRRTTGKTPRLGYQNRQQSIRESTPESPAARPEDLGIRCWYNEQLRHGESTSSSLGGGICDRSSFPSSSSSSYPYNHNREMRSLTVGRPNLSLYSSTASRERESSIESNDAPVSRQATMTSTVPRKAYMDLSDAIALLDETCPNQDASPSLTPRTPRTPLTPFPRGRRARSKSSDNSSNYSNDAGVDKLSETSKLQEKSQQEGKSRRPFLKKIGMSKTEDKPFLAKIIAPRIIGKPYLEKIGPSRAVEKPFLEKIGSSRTLERFNFEALRELPRAMVRKCQPVEPSPLSIERTIRPNGKRDRLEEDIRDDDDDDDDGDGDDGDDDDEDEDDVVLCIIKDERDDDEANDADDDANDDNPDHPTGFIRSGQRTNGKGYLLKMYSFETEDLNDNAEATAAMKVHRDPLRGASLDDVLDSGPSSFPPSEDSHEPPSSRSDERSTSGAELVRCRVTTSEEIFSTSFAHQDSPREATSWGNSPSRWSKSRSKRVTSSPRTLPEQNIARVFPSNDSAPTSPMKRRKSPERAARTVENKLFLSRMKDSSFRSDSTESPLKTRRQVLDEDGDGSSGSRRDIDESGLPFADEDNQIEEDSSPNFAKCKSRRQTFKEAVEKFSANEHTKTRRQVSEEILDRNRKNGELQRFDDVHGHLERRGISSDNLKLSRETMVASVPSTSSLGYQSGDSSLVSQRSSYHSQDFVRGTLKILHDKFELQEVPSESYAAFKRRTRANNQQLFQNIHHQHSNDNQRTNISKIRKECPKETNATKNSINSSDTKTAKEKTLSTGSRASTDSKDDRTRSTSPEKSTDSRSSITVKSVLRKQDGIDHQSDQETDNSSTSRYPKRRIMNEPSQETMDLLTELRRVKSLLKTPSIESEKNNDFSKAPTRYPKKILLTDKEFCLSVERENSVRRRPSSTPVVGEVPMEVWKKLDKDEKEVEDEGKDSKEPEIAVSSVDSKDDREIVQPRRSSRRERSAGLALFEKRCLSLDYADDEKPPKPEARAISLVTSSRIPCSETEVYDNLDSSDPGDLAYDARSYSSDVFTSPSDENEEQKIAKIPSGSFEDSPLKSPIQNTINNHCADIGITIPIDHQVTSISPKKRIHAQERTSDYYEIISPRSTPFRAKKRLGRISAEETVQQESFTINKVDCRSVVTQKRTKCFPL